MAVIVAGWTCSPPGDAAPPTHLSKMKSGDALTDPRIVVTDGVTSVTGQVVDGTGAPTLSEGGSQVVPLKLATR